MYNASVDTAQAIYRGRKAYDSKVCNRLSIYSCNKLGK